MEETLTWRELLRAIISDTQERKRIAAALDINHITLARWASGTTKPRLAILRMLPAAVPQHREQLTRLLQAEYKHLSFDNPTTEADAESMIPSAFYASTLTNYTTVLPMQRAPLLSSAIIQSLLTRLDPTGIGLAVFIAQCVPPLPGQKVHSLRVILPGYSNSSVFGPLEHQTQFFGAESQAGMAAVSARPIAVQTPEEKERMFPTRRSFPTGSSLAVPILQYDRVAGCLCLSSMQAHYFSEVNIELIQHYANLLSVAFMRDDFYPFSDIQLRIMPSRDQQKPIIATLQTRIQQRLIQSLQAQRKLTVIEAELEIIHEIEEELSSLALSSPHPSV